MTLKPHDLSQPQTTVHTPLWFVCSQRQKSYPKVAGHLRSSYVSRFLFLLWMKSYVDDQFLSQHHVLLFLISLFGKCHCRCTDGPKIPHQNFINFFLQIFTSYRTMVVCLVSKTIIPVLGLSSCGHSDISLLSASVSVSIELTPVYIHFQFSRTSVQLIIAT